AIATASNPQGPRVLFIAAPILGKIVTNPGSIIISGPSAVIKAPIPSVAFAII
ncbi:unnamed protein product, partial [marine sediment metagenome]